MMLLDQGNGDHMIDHEFHSDPQSSSFQRPKFDINVASGSPLFICRQYIKDDVMFIKIIVDHCCRLTKASTSFQVLP